MVSCVHRKCQSRVGVSGHISKSFECVTITDSNPVIVYGWHCIWCMGGNVSVLSVILYLVHRLNCIWCIGGTVSGVSVALYLVH